MSNNTDFTNIIFKQQIMDIVGAVLAEKTLQLREEISDRVSELFKGLPAIVIDTHGLEMHGLIEVAEALKEEQEFAHTIYYDVTSKKVYIRTNNVRGMQNDVDLLSPRCPYVCRVPRGQKMTLQEIADKVSEAVERNTMMALIDSKFLAMAEAEKTDLLYSREGISR